MKRLMVVLLSAALLIGCGTSSAQAGNSMFERHEIDADHTILVDRETKVCYLEYGHLANFTSGASWGGITVMLNADGTPKLWEE